MNASNWGIGSCTQENQTSRMWRSVNELSYEHPPRNFVPARPSRPKGAGNASNKHAFNVNAKVRDDHYMSETKRYFDASSSSLNDSYVAEMPAFDRISACKTNYHLGNPNRETKYETSSMSQNAPSKLGPQPTFPARSDLGYNYFGVTFDGKRTVENHRGGAKTCYDKPPPRPKPGYEHDIILAREKVKRTAPVRPPRKSTRVPPGSRPSWWHENRE